MDRSRASTAMGFESNGPKHDEFQVLRQLNEAMDQVRKEEYKRLRNRADRTHIKGNREGRVRPSRAATSS